jgi:hypothetical protein
MPEPSEIWIVEGSSGEYSDHREWPVKAFRDKTKAERLVVEAQARANEITALKCDLGWQEFGDARDAKLPQVINEFDPAMNTSDMPPHYTCYSIELVEG